MKLLTLPQILIFLISLILGRWLGSQYAAEHLAINLRQAASASSHQDVYGKIPSNQVNFLILKVDSIQAEQPRLENLWWLLHKPQGAINLVSIYPSLNHDTKADETLKTGFGISLEADGYQLTRSFELLLQSLNLSWDGFLILDDFAFKEILGNQTPATQEPTAPLPYAESANMLVQWQLFCRKNLQSSWQTPSQNPWVRAFNQYHLSFGPSTSLGLKIWQQLMSDTPTSTCSFPVLENKINH